MSKVSSEHWQQVKELFEQALVYDGAERGEFLERACGDDVQLRNEIDSLLKSYESAESFMEKPAVESAAESLLNSAKKLRAGQRIKNYGIIKAIGEGGMGEVYLARDKTLGRQVALKLLPEYFSNNPERLRRFKQEARTASTLSHPHVCVIHEVSETEDGRPFIAMEYIDGITLREKLNEGGLTLGATLDIVIQVAEALAAAHEVGIIHRDIKPENILIRRDGYVKVVDFGLAKLTEARTFGTDSALSTLLSKSSPGMVMGTVAYMSPEQARGVSVDVRTDIWSLGVVLYEMLTGRPPFAGATPTDVIVGIVEKEQPPIGHYADGVPAEMERIVRKSLRKDPDARYQSIKEFGIDLRSLRKDLEIESELDRSIAPALVASRPEPTAFGRERTTRAEEFQTHTSPGLPSTGKGLAQKIGVVLLLPIAVLTAFGLYKLFKSNGPESHRPPFERINFTKLTTNGNAVTSAISPDGKYAAYVMSDGGKQSLWLRQVAIAGTLQLVPPKDGQYLGVAFSPDGNSIYYGYLATGEKDAEIFLMPVLGTNAQPVKVSPHNGPARLSHDGTRVTFIAYDNDSQSDLLKLANADGSNEQTLLSRHWPARLGWDWASAPAWTPDDKSIALATVTQESSGSYIVGILELELASKTEHATQLATRKFELLGHLELLPDTGGVVLSARVLGASFLQLWILSRDGTARSITSDLSDYRELALTADARHILTIQQQVLSNIWSGTSDGSDHPRQLTSGLGRYFDLTRAPDGKILYASDASGSADIFQLDPNDLSTRQITASAGRNYGPAVSPDNRYIAFHSNRSGMFQIWRVDRDGSNPIQMTKGTVESNWAQFSSDSQYIIYEHGESYAPTTLWKMPVNGGQPVKLTEGLSIRPAVSPDGKSLAYWSREQGPEKPWILKTISLENGAVREYPLASTLLVRWDLSICWTGDGRGISYVDQRGGIDNLWVQPVSGGPAKQATDFKDSRIFSFYWGQDGTLISSRGTSTSDVVLITDAGQ